MKLYLRILVSAYLSFSLYAGLTGDVHLWGANHLALFPAWVAISLYAASLILVWGSTPLGGLLQRIACLSRGKQLLRAAAIGGLALAASLFVLFRSQNHLLGDGYQVLSNITNPEILVPTEVLDLLSHRLLYYIVGDPELSYLILSVASGLLFLMVVFLFARRITGHTVERVGVAGVFLGLAQVQFFFGYAENYTVMTAFVALFLYLGWRNSVDNHSLLSASLAFVIAGLFHVSAWSLLPGFLYLFLLRSRRAGNAIYMAIGGFILLLASVAAVIYYTTYEGEQIFAPIFATRMNPYTMLSSSHVFDFVNILLLVAPLPLIAIVSVLLGRHLSGRLKSPEVAFLILCGLGGLLFSVAIDPKLGAIRDWDLLAIFGIPLAFLAAYLTVGVISSKGLNTVLAGTGLALLLVHTVPWIASNTMPISAKEKIKGVIASDVHYSPDYYEGYRLISWADLLFKEPYCDYEEAARACSLRMQGRPDDFQRYIVYATACYFNGRTKQASDALAAVKHVVLDVPRSINLIRLHLRLGEVEEAERIVNVAIKKFPDHKVIQFFYAVVSQLRQRPDSALRMVQKAVEHSPNAVSVLSDGAVIAIYARNYQLASTYIGLVEAQPVLRCEEQADIDQIKRMLSERTGSR